MNLMRLANRVICVLEDSGLLAEVTFKRIDPTLAEPDDDFLFERDDEDKEYLSYEIKAMVEENPKTNIYGPGGGEVIGDLKVTWYGNQHYTPDEADHILWRGDEYEVTKKERLMPSGKDAQLGWTVVGTKF